MNILVSVLSSERVEVWSKCQCIHIYLDLNSATSVMYFSIQLSFSLSVITFDKEIHYKNI